MDMTGDARREDAPKLSPRQLECLTRIAQGETSAQIARALGLKKRTVDEYVSDACARLGVKKRSQAVAISLGLNLIPAPPRA